MMTEFQQDTEETPVLFRVHRAPTKHGNEVTAVFPCEPHDINGLFMTCYVHVGQHGACGLDWYRQTRPARADEYAALKQELESAPFGYRLKIRQRMTPGHRDRFHQEVARIRRLDSGLKEQGQ